jgi:hypothetical protein
MQKNRILRFKRKEQEFDRMLELIYDDVLTHTPEGIGREGVPKRF